MRLSYEQFMLIFYVGVVAAAIFFVLSVVLFFILKVPEIIGDLSGTTARKAIENIRLQNTDSLEKVYKSSKENAKRGKITEQMPSNSVKLGTTQAEKMRTEITTARLHTPSNEETIVLNVSQKADNELRILFDEASAETQVLENINDPQTGTVIADNVEYLGQTTVLGDETQVLVQADSALDCYFTVVTEITLFESQELIM